MGCSNAEALSLLDTNSRTPSVNTCNGTALFVPYIQPTVTNDNGLWRLCPDTDTGIKLIPASSQCPIPKKKS